MDLTPNTPQFFLTAPVPCPYLPGRMERKIFTHLIGDRARELNDVLSHGGFRRSQTIAYRPACEACRACISVRTRVGDFRPSRSQRRVVGRNRDIIGTMVDPKPTSEQYSLFCRYLEARHGDGGMTDMSALDFATMVEDSFVQTRLIEYRRRDADSGITGKSEGELLGVCLTDLLCDGLSMVYSFFSTHEARRSLGTLMILDHIERCRKMRLPYLYLGYWVEGSPKMAYKANFQPQEKLGANGWREG